LHAEADFTYKAWLVSIRVLLGISLSLLALSAVFGFLNTGKVKALRAETANAIAARTMAENARIAQRKPPRSNENKNSAVNSTNSETQARLAEAEAQTSKAESEKAAALAKLQSAEAQLAQLQRQGQGTDAAESSAPPGQGVTELQTQLDDARRQLENAEREKAFVTEKTQESGPRVTVAPQEQVKRRRPSQEAGLHGVVLAVNQAYNFVVLNLGGRQGVEPNAEMLVLRGGALIGKIRVSTVEPATAIGDIITSSLPRGVQVQPGDAVVYVGTDS
jgi:hypothetical protein